MPDFLGIGAQKAGTTWLYANLARHPGLYLPPVKELHFWDLFRDRGLDWYRAQFAPGRAAGLRCGEITPAYAILPPDRVREIRGAFLELRLVYIVRNPIERAWSAALMALERAELEFDEASEQWFIDHFRSAGSLRRGDYAACLRTWLAAYPADRLLLLDYGGIASDPRALLKSVAAHLGADAGWFDSADAAALAAPVHFGYGGSTSGARHSLPAGLRSVLRELYEGRIRAFYRDTGRDFGWL